MADEINQQEVKNVGRWKRIVKRILLVAGATVLSCVFLLVSSFLFLLYSPWTHTFRDRYVLMTYQTSNPWLCTLFFRQATIDAIFEQNGSVQPDGVVDTSLIKPVISSTPAWTPTPENPTANPTYTPTPSPSRAPVTLKPTPILASPFKSSAKYSSTTIYHDGEVCIVEFSGKTSIGKYTARMIQVRDPSRVTLGVTDRLGEHGQHLVKICENNNAFCGINAGGFEDEGGTGHGGTPLGVVVKDGVYNVYTEETDHVIIGFNQDNILVMGKFSEEEVQANGIRDAMSWRNPAYLILNGEVVQYNGLAGGYDPRSAIGQCADGTVLLLVVDGSSLRGIDGVDFAMMADIMYEFGAVNAANLDGGTSSTMALNGKVINSVCNPQIAYNGRWLATAWLIEKR